MAHSLKINPRLERNGLLLVSTAVVGPALVVSGLRYPGSWKAKAALGLLGLAVSGMSYYYLSSDLRGDKE